MTQSIRSLSKRSSKDLKKGSTELGTGSKNEILSKHSSMLAAIQREESNDLSIIYSIREELIKNVLDECIKRDQDKITVKYMVRCAYEAIKRIIELEFNMHDFGKEDFEVSASWMPESKPMHSPPDTWAAFNVPVVSTSDDEETVDKPETLVSIQTKASEHLDHSSRTQTDQSTDLTPQQSITSFVEQYLIAPHSSEVEMEEYLEDDEEYYMKKEKSVFTTLMTCSTESNPFTQYSTNMKWKEQPPKVQKATKAVLEKKSSKAPQPKLSITSLPPLRAEAQLKIMGSFAKDPPKKDAKK